jgi:carboxymethylenebutenolidase
MCYSDAARPPLPPVGGAAADQGDMTLEAADGNKFMAYFARAAQPTGAGMVVLPDVRGLHHFYKELAQRFAEAGIDAVAIDYYGRTAGSGDRSESFEYASHLDKTTQENCFGGSSSWNQSALNPGLSGCIGFYGRPARSESYISKMKAPLLLLVAGADAATPLEVSREFERKLTAAGVPHEMHIYEGAPHSFFDRMYEQWKDACDDAWRRILAFVKKYS